MADTPSSPARPRLPTGLAALISPNGRIGPIEFWIGLAAHTWLLHLIGVDQWVRTLERGLAPQLGGGMRVAVFVADMWLLWVHLARRWHDLGFRAGWTAVLLVPGLGWLFAFVMLGLVPGARAPNRWGPPRPWWRAVRELKDAAAGLAARAGDLRVPAFDGPPFDGSVRIEAPSPIEPMRPSPSPPRVDPPPAAPRVHRGPIAPPSRPVVVRRRRGLFG